jgi:peptidylprolyl isomerase
MKALHLVMAAALLLACSGEDAKVRQRLLQIEQFEDRGTLGPERELTTLLYSMELEVRERAVLAMGRIEDPTSIDEINRATTLDTPLVRAAAAWAMGRLAATYESEVPQSTLTGYYTDTASATRRNIIDALAFASGAETQQFLHVFGLLDGNPSTRGAAALALGKLGQLDDPRDLFAMLRDQNAEVRWRAAWALWRLKHPRSKVVAEAALRDDDARVRMFAARALGEVGDAASADSLAQLLADSDWRVRNDAADAIGKIGQSDAALDRLVQSLDGELHELTARTMVEAIGRAGRPGDLGVLRQALRRRSATIWQGLINAVADGYTDSAYAFIQAIITDRRPTVARAAMAALGRIQDEPSRALLAQTYPDLDPTSQGFALAALSEYGFGAAEPFLDEALASDNLILADAAVRALARDPDTMSIRLWLDFWDAHAEDTLPDLKLAALEAGSTIVDSVHVRLGRTLQHAFRAAANDSDRLVRQAAIAGLDKMGFDLSKQLGEFRSNITEDNYDDIFRAFRQNPTATITTVRGDIRIELRYDKAPRTVHNFVTLARDGFYDSTVFHRVVPNFVIQGGDPTGTGSGGPGYTIRSQYNDLEYTTGAVGMASSGKDTEGSQFFITHCPTPHLDDRYTLFGYVTAGQEIVDRIRQGDIIRTIVIGE